MAKVGLQPEPEYVTTVLNLDETIKSRHGVMVIGETMVGKSCALKLIHDTYNALHREEIEKKFEDFAMRKALALGMGPST